MTIIVADTTCGLPRDLLTQRGISVIPQVVTFGKDSFHDDTAALEFPKADIFVVNTSTVSCNLGSLVLVADDMAKAVEPAVRDNHLLDFNYAHHTDRSQ